MGKTVVRQEYITNAENVEQQANMKECDQGRENIMYKWIEKIMKHLESLNMRSAVSRSHSLRENKDDKDIK